MGKYHTKNGKEVYLSNRGHRPTMQWTVQGEEINNHQARRGTKRKASNRGCHCEDCVGGTDEIKEKIAQKEFQKALTGEDI